MLIRSTWTLTVAEATTLPRSYGLGLVKQLHQRLGIEIGTEPIPATTCSGLLGNVSVSGDFLTFYPDEHYQLSLCGLRENESKAIAYLDLSDSLEFLGVRFTICDRQNVTSSYECLYQTLVANEPEPPRRFNLQFITPTAFAQNRIYLPLPVPTLMFRSWLERWNHFAPVYLGGDELIAYLGGAIALNRHKLQTASFRVHLGQATGFKGNLSLQVLNRIEPLLANVAHLLIHYAEFAGTGIKTRLGMGQTILIKPKTDAPRSTVLRENETRR
jgi:CRISPR-associated endoribonuclease Cas6